MDVFAHALWGYVVFRKRALTKWAVVTSVMPDVLSFGMFMLISLINGNFVPGKPHSMPAYVDFMYSVTHSLFIIAVFGVFVYWKYKKYLVLVAAWMMHVTIDIFTHTEQFFPTPFLYPVSSFHVSVISWGNKWFMLANYSALLLVYSIIGFSKLRRKKHFFAY